MVRVLLDRLDQPVLFVARIGFLPLLRISRQPDRLLVAFLLTVSRSFKSMRTFVFVRSAISCSICTYLALFWRLRRCGAPGAGSSSSSTMSYSSLSPSPLRLRLSSCSAASVEVDL